MKRLYLLCFTALLCAAGLVCALLLPAKAVFAPQSDRRLLVIDAGHGGADGGAVSLDGSVKESTVNLQIAQRLALLLMFCGACAGSTAGGIKLARLMLLAKNGRREIK